MKDAGKLDKPLLSVKNDFVFKLFGWQNHKNPLISFLSAVMGLPKSKSKDIQMLNTELFREFREDKKGILDVRAETLEGE